MFPSHCGAWIPPMCIHSARSVGSACGSMAYLSEETCRGLPKKPCMFSSSELLFATVHRMRAWNPRQALDRSQKRLVAVLRDEIRGPEEQPLRLPMPKEASLSKVAYLLLENVGDNRLLDEWGRYAGMSRRTFMRTFSAQVGMTFGRWRQQARLFAAVEMLTKGKSVTETALAVGYDSVSAFIEMFRTTLGSAPQEYLRRQQQ
jgi:AraC-like DNA-binding protein